jgi:hypothetical protein
MCQLLRKAPSTVKVGDRSKSPRFYGFGNTE